MNAPFEWASLFTAEKCNVHPGLNERSPPPLPTLLKPRKRRVHVEICNVYRGAHSDAHSSGEYLDIFY